VREAVFQYPILRIVGCKAISPTWRASCLPLSVSYPADRRLQGPRKARSTCARRSFSILSCGSSVASDAVSLAADVDAILLSVSYPADRRLQVVRPGLFTVSS